MTAPEQTAHTGRDIPIIFSAPMVRALLDGRKTMTRRLANRRVDTGCDDDRPAYAPSPWQQIELGDRLWVREGWKPHSLYEAMKPRDMPQSKIFYLADETFSPSGSRGRPSIHMPRWASRLTLTVTATKIERLQKISDGDVLQEGIQRKKIIVEGEEYDGYSTDFSEGANDTARRAFEHLWVSLHGIDAWNDNPEVVALTFTVHKQNIDATEPARSPAPPFAGTGE